MDRCRVWVIHADPAVRRISKPNPDPTYPAYAVGDADSDNEATRVAVVTGQRLGQNQLEDLLRWVISTAEPPAPKPEVPDVEKLLQQLVRGTQSRSPAVVSPPMPTALEQMLHSFFDGQRQRQRLPPQQRPTRRDWTDVVWCGLKGLRLRTLLDVSVLMMLLDYDRIRALCGCQMIECFWRTLSRHMGEGCHRPIDISELPDGFGHTVVEGGPVGPEVIEPLELLVLDHADPAGQHAVFRDTTRLLEHPLTRPDSSLGDGLVEKISDWEPAAPAVPDTTLDGRLREGNTYLEHSAPGASRRNYQIGSR